MTIATAELGKTKNGSSPAAQRLGPFFAGNSSSENWTWYEQRVLCVWCLCCVVFQQSISSLVIKFMYSSCQNIIQCMVKVIIIVCVLCKPAPCLKGGRRGSSPYWWRWPSGPARSLHPSWAGPQGRHLDYLELPAREYNSVFPMILLAIVSFLRSLIIKFSFICSCYILGWMG